MKKHIPTYKQVLVVLIWLLSVILGMEIMYRHMKAQFDFVYGSTEQAISACQRARQGCAEKEAACRDFEKAAKLIRRDQTNGGN